MQFLVKFFSHYTVIIKDEPAEIYEKAIETAKKAHVLYGKQLHDAVIYQRYRLTQFSPVTIVRNDEVLTVSALRKDQVSITN